MKRYLMGLALSGLASRLSRRTRSAVPWNMKKSTPKRTPSFLLGAGLGAGLAYYLSQRRNRR